MDFIRMLLITKDANGSGYTLNWKQMYQKLHHRYHAHREGDGNVRISHRYSPPVLHGNETASETPNPFSWKLDGQIVTLDQPSSPMSPVNRMYCYLADLPFWRFQLDHRQLYTDFISIAEPELLAYQPTFSLSKVASIYFEQ